MTKKDITPADSHVRIFLDPTPCVPVDIPTLALDAPDPNVAKAIAKLARHAGLTDAEASALFPGFVPESKR